MKKMDRKIVGLVLLLALFFNTAHALIIHTEEQCIHETVTEFVQEFDHGSDCGDLCDVHHFFHIPAIPITPTPVIVAFPKPQPVEYRPHKHTPPLLKPSYRPPIA